MHNHKKMSKDQVEKSRKVKPHQKAIVATQKKKADGKRKLKEDLQKKKQTKEDEEWKEGTNLRAKSKADLVEQRKLEAKNKKIQKKTLLEREEAHISTIKIRAGRGRSKSMGESPTSRPRKPRSVSLDETSPISEWKTPPKNTRRQSEVQIKKRITVLTMNGDETLLLMPKSSTVLDIKKRMEQLKGFPAVSQELLSPERSGPLIDGHKLDNLNLPNGAVIFCSNDVGTVNNWANFHHFRSPHKQKKHIAFSEDEKTATKSSVHPSATYIFTSGSVAGDSGPVRVWQLMIHELVDKSRMVIGLFEGRDLKMQEDPFPPKKAALPWGATTGAGAVDTQSPMWCISTDGKFRTPDEVGFMPARVNWGEKRFGAGDLLQLTLHPERQVIEFHVTRAGEQEEPAAEADPAESSESGSEDEEERKDVIVSLPEHLFTLPLGLTGQSAGDLHLFATLHSKGDSVTIKEVL